MLCKTAAEVQRALIKTGTYPLTVKWNVKVKKPQIALK